MPKLSSTKLSETLCQRCLFNVTQDEPNECKVECEKGRVTKKCERCKTARHVCKLMPVSKRLCKAVNLTLRFRRKLSRIEDPLGETALAMGERFERAASVARTLCIAASRVEGRLGGTTKPTLESVTIEQARSLRSVDKTLKGIHKELRRRAHRPLSSSTEADDESSSSDDGESSGSETEGDFAA